MKRTDYGYADLTKKEVYDFRKALNLSQAKLSKKLGLSLRTWCHYEYGTQRTPVSVHMALQHLQNGGGEAEKVHENVKMNETDVTQTVKPLPQVTTRSTNSALDLNNLTEEEVTGFLADLNPDELDVLDETTDPEDQAVEVFLIQALQSKKDILYEQIKDIDLKAIQNSQLFRK